MTEVFGLKSLARSAASFNIKDRDSRDLVWTAIYYVALRPALALVDIEMPNLDGLELGGCLLQEKWPIRVIAMSGLIT